MMSKNDPPVGGDTRAAVLARVRALVPLIRANAGAAEDARTLPRQSVDALLAAGICRILVPNRYGGYGSSLDTWFDVVLRDQPSADASHGWCAALIWYHHPHLCARSFRKLRNGNLVGRVGSCRSRLRCSRAPRQA